MRTYLCTCTGYVTDCRLKAETPASMVFYLTCEDRANVPVAASGIFHLHHQAWCEQAICQPVDEHGEPLPLQEEMLPPCPEPRARRIPRKAPRQLNLSFNP